MRKYKIEVLVVCDDVLAIKEQLNAALEAIPGVEAVLVPDVRYQQGRMY